MALKKLLPIVVTFSVSSLLGAAVVQAQPATPVNTTLTPTSHSVTNTTPVSSSKGSTTSSTAVQTLPTPGTVAITFDDGPSRYTPQILAILKKYHVKATFFMVGEMAKRHPEIVKMVLADGHAIGNHTNSHPFLTKLNDDRLVQEIDMPQTIIFGIAGVKPVCLRYPYDAHNQHVNNTIRQQGLTPVGVDLDSRDYKRPGVDKMVASVVGSAKSGSVILFHDGCTKREQTVAALSRVIEGIQKKGLGFSQICAQ